MREPTAATAVIVAFLLSNGTVQGHRSEFEGGICGEDGAGGRRMSAVDLRRRLIACYDPLGAQNEDRNDHVDKDPERGAPQNGFSMLICRISARGAVSICVRPPAKRDCQCQ